MDERLVTAGLTKVEHRRSEEVPKARGEGMRLTTRCVIDKYEGDYASEAVAQAAGAKPYERLIIDGNLALNAGLALMLDLLIAAGGTSFANANARLAVGDSSTAAAASQTDLQAATNKLRKAMDATFPSRSSQTLTFKSTFATGDANFAWNEWGIANSSSGATMLNRKVESMGTKSAGQTWVMTATVTAS
jgi:hypothetical protein